MKELAKMAVAAALLGLFAGAGAMAQQPVSPQGQGMPGMGMMHAEGYDPKTVETVSGEVVSVERTTPKDRMPGSGMMRMGYGVHLLLRTVRGTIAVLLGPAWYMENQAMKIAPMDKIEVKGSRITLDGKPALVAAQVTKGDELLTLRDNNGFPVWMGGRRR